MVWGADLYNLPFITEDFYEPINPKTFVKKQHCQRMALPAKSMGDQHAL